MASKRKAEPQKLLEEEEDEEVDIEKEDEDEEEVDVADDSDDSDEGGELEEAVSLTAKEDEELVDVEFEFYDPQPSDFHGVRVLLRKSLWDHMSFSPLSDSIVSQVEVGTMVKLGDLSDSTKAAEREPYGFVTLLSLAAHKVRSERPARGAKRQLTGARRGARKRNVGW